jgi:hypothetical protein
MLEDVVVRTAGGSELWAMAGTGINKVENLYSATGWFQLVSYNPIHRYKNNTFNHLPNISGTITTSSSLN